MKKVGIKTTKTLIVFTFLECISVLFKNHIFFLAVKGV